MRRHTWRLKPEQRENLQRYLSDYPVLEALYDAKQRLNELLLLKNLRKKTAQKKLPSETAGADRAAVRHSPLLYSRFFCSCLWSQLSPPRVAGCSES
jgi:transposase